MDQDLFFPIWKSVVQKRDRPAKGIDNLSFDLRNYDPRKKEYQEA